MSLVISQVGFLFSGLQPYFLYQNTESLQGMSPDIILTLDVNSDHQSNTSGDIRKFNNITRTLGYTLPTIVNEMYGVYTKIVVNGTSTWKNSRDYWSGRLIGLDDLTLQKFNTLISGTMPENNTEVLLIQDRKATYYNTNFNIGNITEIFAIYSGNITDFKKESVQISGLLELDYPSSDSRGKHEFPYLLPQDIFDKGLSLIFVTSLLEFHQLYQKLQNPPFVEYTIFKHLWFDKSTIIYQRLDKTFYNINYYVDRVSELADFEFEGFIVESYNFLFESPILTTLDKAKTIFRTFLLIGVFFSIPLIGGTFLLANYLTNISQEKLIKKKLLLRLRGHSLVSLTSSLVKEYSINIFAGVIIGNICAFLILVAYTSIFSHSFKTYSFKALNIDLEVFFTTIPITLFSILIYSLYRLRMIYSILKKQSEEDIAKNLTNIASEEQDYLDIYFFSLGIFSIIARYIFNSLIPQQFRILQISQMLYFFNIVGFFGIIFGSLGLIRRTINVLENGSIFSDLFTKSIYSIQILIALRQKKHYIRLIQILVFIILLTQLLVIFNNSVIEHEKKKALYQVGAEGYINSPKLKPEVIEHFSIIKNTSITIMTIQFYEGEYKFLGVDPESYFDIAYLPYRIPKSTIDKMKNNVYGVLHNAPVIANINNKKLTLHYHNISFDLLSLNLTLIEKFESWPRLQKGITTSDEKLIVINRIGLERLLETISGADISQFEEGSLVEINEDKIEISQDFLEFNGYILEYYSTKVNILFLDLISAEVFYFLMNGLILSVLSVIIMFLAIVRIRGKVLSLDLIFGMTQKSQFLLLEIGSYILLLLCILWGSIMSIIAAICLLNLYQIVNLEFPITLELPIPSILMIVFFFIISPILSLPFKLKIYQRENLFQNIREL